MESWRLAFRKAVPFISTKGLMAVADALLAKDPRLVQGATTVPFPLMDEMRYPVQGACLIGYAGWQGDGLQTMDEVEEYFSSVCSMVDSALGEPGGVRYLLNWYDDTPVEEVARSLIPEISRALAIREGAIVHDA